MNYQRAKESDLTIEEIGKKVAIVESSMTKLENLLKDELNQRIMLEKRTNDLTEEFTKDISALKTGFDSYSLAFTDGIEKMKNLINEDVEFKIKSLTKFVMDSLNKFESQVNNRNFRDNFEDSSILNTNMNPLESRIAKIEQFLFSEGNNNLSSNTLIARLGFCEKKVDDSIKKFNFEINSIKNSLVEVKSDVEMLKSYKEISTKNYDHLQRDFICTNSNNTKFNYQTQMLLNEAKNKMKLFEEKMNNDIEFMNKIKNDIANNISEIKKSIDVDLEQVSSSQAALSNETKVKFELFDKHITTQNEGFINFIQDKMEEFCDKFFQQFQRIEGEINSIKGFNDSLTEKVGKMQKDIFNSINEMDEINSKKFESLNRVITGVRY